MQEYYTGDEKKDRIIAMRVGLKIVLILLGMMLIFMLILIKGNLVAYGIKKILMIILGTFLVVGLFGFIGYKFRIKDPEKIERIKKWGGPRWLAYVYIFGGGIFILINIILFFIESFKNYYLIQMVFGIIIFGYGINSLRKYKKSESNKISFQGSNLTN